jgi:hypothetical protein
MNAYEVEYIGLSDYKKSVVTASSKRDAVQKQVSNDNLEYEDVGKAQVRVYPVGDPSESIVLSVVECL